MTEIQILENNKLIADFMKLNRDSEAVVFQGKAYTYDQLKFDLYWDWLMPVWLKMLKWGSSEFGVQWTQEITQDCVKISTNKHNIYDFCWPCFQGTVKIKDVYYVMTECIKFYNDYKIKNPYNFPAED